MRFAICFALAACSAPRPAPRYPVVPPVACSARATIAVLGGVTRPGTFACHPGMRLVEAMVAAGGLSPIGWGDHTQLRRDHRATKADHRIRCSQPTTSSWSRAVTGDHPTDASAAWRPRNARVFTAATEIPRSWAISVSVRPSP
jgi:hypothetical protein